MVSAPKNCAPTTVARPPAAATSSMLDNAASGWLRAGDMRSPSSFIRGLRDRVLKGSSFAPDAFANAPLPERITAPRYWLCGIGAKRFGAVLAAQRELEHDAPNKDDVAFEEDIRTDHFITGHECAPSYPYGKFRQEQYALVDLACRLLCYYLEAWYGITTARIPDSSRFTLLRGWYKQITGRANGNNFTVMVDHGLDDLSLFCTAIHEATHLSGACYLLRGHDINTGLPYRLTGGLGFQRLFQGLNEAATELFAAEAVDAFMFNNWVSRLEFAGDRHLFDRLDSGYSTERGANICLGGECYENEVRVLQLLLDRLERYYNLPDVAEGSVRWWLASAYFAGDPTFFGMLHTMLGDEAFARVARMHSLSKSKCGAATLRYLEAQPFSPDNQRVHEPL